MGTESGPRQRNVNRSKAQQRDADRSEAVTETKKTQLQAKTPADTVGSRAFLMYSYAERKSA